MLASSGWSVSPGDFVELQDGRRGTVLETAKMGAGYLLGVNVGFEWRDAGEIISWIPKD